MVFLPRFYYTLVTAILLALASTGVANGMTASLILTLMLTGSVAIEPCTANNVNDPPPGAAANAWLPANPVAAANAARAMAPENSIVRIRAPPIFRHRI